MTTELKVVCHENCGNAPRKEILRDLTIALVTKNIPYIQEWFSENIVWRLIGNRQFTEKEQVLKHISSMSTSVPLQLKIDNIITHGKVASINGNVKFQEGKILEFCDVYEFVSAGKNAKIKDILSYHIPVC